MHLLEMLFIIGGSAEINPVGLQIRYQKTNNKTLPILDQERICFKVKGDGLIHDK